MDPDMLQIRLDREDYWMKTLRTVYPYGLNERTKKMNKFNPVGTLFCKLPRYGERNHITDRSNRNKFTNLTIFLTEIEQQNKEERANFLRKKLETTSIKTLRKLAIEATNLLGMDPEACIIRWLDLIKDIFYTKTFKKDGKKNEDKKPKIRFPIYFHNKGIEQINIQKILRQQDVINCLPNNYKEEHHPCVTFKLTSPIRSKVINYKEVVEKIDKNDLNTYGTGITECNCKDSLFCDLTHKHIITGNLQFISNSKLRKIFIKGPNYREPNIINWKKCLQCIQIGLDKCEEFVKKEYKGYDFSRWKECILENVNKKISLLKKKVKPRNTKSIFKDTETGQYLENLQKNVVIVPIDKASSNLAIICKKYYAEVILNELGVIGNGSNTYTIVDKEDGEVIEADRVYCEKIKIKQGDENKKLPIMYWIPKMHKNPIGKRFIVASKKCSLKPLVKTLSDIFKMFYYQIETFHKNEKFLAHYNQFWVLKNANPIIDIINNINRKKNAKSICTYDFSTLYTNILHKSLIEKLEEIIDFVFNGEKKNMYA